MPLFTGLLVVKWLRVEQWQKLPLLKTFYFSIEKNAHSYSASSNMGYVIYSLAISF